MLEYEQIIARQEGVKIYIDKFPEHVLISPRVLGEADKEIVSTLITITAENGEATYRVVGMEGSNLAGERCV